MFYTFLFIHVIISLLLCIVVLLQRSKGGGLAGAFGGVGAGEALFGARGVTTFLHKATIWLAVLFMVSSLGLALIVANRGGPTEGSLSRQAAERVRVPTSSQAVPVEGGGTVLEDEGSTDIVPPPAESSTEETPTVPASDETEEEKSAEKQESGGG